MKASGMNPAAWPCLLLSVGLLLISGAGCTGPRLDHFKVYDVKDVPTEKFAVRLTGQFDQQGQEAFVVALTHFANPVAKTPVGAARAKIKDRNAHLTWYQLEQPKPEPRRTVRFKNQFGQHSVDIRKARYLLVPAQKRSDPDSKFPERLDHFKCYEVEKVNVFPGAPVVTLEDQFGVQDNVQVTPPVLFCVPVVKERKGEEPRKLVNKKDHLTIYKITPKPFDGQIKIRDQFMDIGLSPREGIFLAVPTEKQVFVTHDN